jgi:hypothetical protein
VRMAYWWTWELRWLSRVRGEGQCGVTGNVDCGSSRIWGAEINQKGRIFEVFQGIQ